MIINELRSELSKMKHFYCELRLQVEQFIVKVQKTDSSLDTSPLKNLAKALVGLEENLTEVGISFNDNNSDECFAKVTSLLESNINDLNPEEKTSLADEILGYLDKGLEIHEVQKDQFDNIRTLLEMCSSSH